MSVRKQFVRQFAIASRERVAVTASKVPAKCMYGAGVDGVVPIEDGVQQACAMGS
jgi:hypothetical protein